jgi:hypothetical protein
MQRNVERRSSDRWSSLARPENLVLPNAPSNLDGRRLTVALVPACHNCKARGLANGQRGIAVADGSAVTLGDRGAETRP